jgi:hypothetical protein
VVEDGADRDDELLSFYSDSMTVNHKMNIANELFNLHKTTTLEPFVWQGQPRLRPIPSDRSLFYSDDKIDPTNPTHWVKYMGEMKINGKDKKVYYIYTDTEFLPIDDEGNILEQILIESENPEGINPYGKIPAVYVNRSFYSITPPADTDTMKMTKLIPVLLSDLNHAVQFQAFSIMYSIDADIENPIKAPNAFWNFKSDATSDKKPEVNVLKPDVDIDSVIQLIQSEMVLWLNSRNIRPGSVGDLSADNMVSGISKIIDESDTVEDRQAQIPYFEDAEDKMWRLIFENMHPYWRRTGQVDTNLDWTPGAYVRTEFQEQLPLVRRADMLKQLIEEVGAGFTTRRIAIKRLNSEMTDDEIDALMAEIDEDRSVDVKMVTEQDNEAEEVPSDETDEVVEE